MIFQIIWLVIVAAIVAMIVLMLARFIINYADMNPFSRPVMFVRNLTDPFVNPVRRALQGLGIQANGAPLVVILLTILVGYFAITLASDVLNTAAGIVLSLTSGKPGGIIALFGYILYGLLALYGTLLFIRIIFSWGRIGYSNSVMRFLMRVTDPVLVPLRHMVPPLGMLDISPLVAFFIIWLFQLAVSKTLLYGWPLAIVG